MRALPACGIAALLLLMNVGAVSTAMSRAGTRIGWSRFIAGELALLVIMAVSVAVLMAIELMRVRHGRLAPDR